MSSRDSGFGTRNPDSKIVLRAGHIAKTYREGKLRTPVLHDASFDVARGETLAIVGA